jgi:glycosyltransferase involved in cell wall biosynthesis
MNKRSWSGTSYYMVSALQKHFGDVTCLGPAPGSQLLGKYFNKFTHVVLGKRYDYSHSLSYARHCARFFERRLQERHFDVIFAPAASAAIAFLITKIPIIYLSDATFALLQNYYPEFTGLLARSIHEGNTLEQESIRKSEIALYSSDWAAQSAVSDYGADPDKIHIIPFGANMETIPERSVALLKQRSGPCTLLLLGVDWERKGGAIAYETLLQLLKMGMEARLIVCGCIPPPTFSSLHMTVIPFLDKNDISDVQRLSKVLNSSHFLLLPTRAECAGIVFCEANAYGLPAITTATGGVTDLVRDGENGYCLPYDAGGEEYAKLIFNLYRDKVRYHELVRLSRDRYEMELNWDSWGIKVKQTYDKRHGEKAKSRTVLR